MTTPRAQHRPLKLRLTLGAAVGLGPGKVDLLDAVDRCGSITAAAKDQGMSYRRAWLLIDEMNKAFRDPVVTTSSGGLKGGGTALSPAGRQIITVYRQAVVKTEQAIAEELAFINGLLADSV